MTETVTDGLEIKAGAGSDNTALFQLMNAFETFKQDNDARLERLEKRGATDPLTEEKLERINAALDGYKAAMDRVALDRARPALESGRSEAGDEYKEAFSAYVKRGEEKSLSIGTNSDGGYVVPGETEAEITRRLTEISPIRSIAGVRQVSSAVYKRPISISGPATGWVGEKDARPQTASQTIDAISYPAMELYAMPAATASFLDDAAVDVGQWIADEVNAAFAEQVWFHVALAGRTRAEVGIPETVDESFVLADDDTVEAAIADYERVCAEAREIASGYALDDVARHNRRGPLTLRWIYVHMVEELARHAGHADILREQILNADS